MSASVPPSDTSSPAHRRRRIRLALAIVGGVVALAPMSLIVIARLNTIAGLSQVELTRLDTRPRG